MRCYLASLQGGELPNPKSLLAIASRPTKTTLGRLGIFSVSSFHALVRNILRGDSDVSEWDVLIYLMSSSNLENSLFSLV